MIKMIDPQELTVLVTGATAGFGAAVCRRFHAAGARVIGTGRRVNRLEELANELGERCHVVQLDVTDNDAVHKAVSTLPEPFASPNVCVVNAGLALGLERAQEADLGNWMSMVSTNINGALSTVHSVLPGMINRNDGHIVLVGSVAGDYPSPGSNVYGATKAFIKQFALNLRADVLGSDIRITNLEPGMAETEFSLVRFKGDDARADDYYRGARAMSADDIAETVFWSCTLPRHLNVNRLQIMPVDQSFGPLAIARK